MYTGITAKVSIGDKNVAYISNFSIEQTRDIIESSWLGVDAKDKEYGRYSWSASADGAADFVNDEAQAKLHEAMKNRTPMAVVFYLNEKETLSGTALVESLSIDLSAEDKGNISISLNGKGHLEYAKQA